MTESMRKSERGVFAERLAETGALTFGGPYRLRSGRESPYFFSCARFVATGRDLALLAGALARDLLNSGVEFDYLHGVAAKGVPLAAAFAVVLAGLGREVRWGYDRKVPKDHGDPSERWLVGDLRRGDRVVVVDDVLSAGHAKRAVISRLKESGCEVVALLLVLDREERGAEGLRKELFVVSLLTVADVFQQLRKRGSVSDAEYDAFLMYQRRYGILDETGEEGLP